MWKSNVRGGDISYQLDKCTLLSGSDGPNIKNFNVDTISYYF